MNPKIVCFPSARVAVVGLGVALLLTVVARPVLAQSPASTAAPQAVPALNAASQGPRNGLAEKPRPAVTRKAALQAQPYLPIKKQDDGDQVPEIEMFVGESRVFPAPNVGRIAVGNGQIMTAAALDKKEVLVFANGAGTSSLFVWNEDGRYQRIKIHIVAGDTARVAREVAAFLTTIAHAKASIVGDKVIVEGDNLSDADLAKIDQLEKRYPQLINFTNRVGWEQMVMMDVKVVEFPKSELRDIGLKWGAVGGSTIGATWEPIRRGSNGPYAVNIPSTSTGLPITSQIPGQPAVLPGPLNILGAINLGLSAQLNLLEQAGKASVLAEPQLSARNGAKASFLAGGEFPYSVSNVNGVTIIFKPYGIKLDISPKVDRNGVIRATIAAEVSSIDASVSAVGGPALLTRRTDTEFNVRSGQTIVLAGLLQRNISTDIDKVPLLGDVPVLGALFRSKRFQNKETELVVFVTPTVVDSQSAGLVDRVNRTTERLGQQMGRQPYLSEPLQPNVPAARFDHAPSGTAWGAKNGHPVPAMTPSVAPAPVSALGPVPIPAPAPAGMPLAVVGVSPVAVPPAGLQASLPVAPAQTFAQPLRFRVLLAGLAMRVAPDINSPIVMKLGSGRVVDSRPEPGQGPWTAVDVGGKHGWVASKWLSPEDALAKH
ncbi:MAG: pilus assembly protein N-terminal domain-containing protein [Herminiimonas sp.]|nr:pilus assembly protein N-terminal domain-containing protein [Herminiimonas sp.]